MSFFVEMLDRVGATLKLAASQRAGDSAWIPQHQSVIMTVQATMTRPGNASAYIAGDVEGQTAAPFYYSVDLSSYGIRGGLIVSARMIRNSLNNTGVRRRVMIHDAALTTGPAADNDPFPLLWANRQTRRGWIDFKNAALPSADFGSGTDCTEWVGDLSSVQGIPVAPSDGILRCHSVVLDAYTPGESSTVSILELGLVV